MGDPRAADLNQALPTPLAFGAEQAGADVLPNEWKQSFLTTGKHTEAWCFLYETDLSLRVRPILHSRKARSYGFLPLSDPYPGLSRGGMLSGRDCLSAGLGRLLPFRAIPFVSYLVQEERGRLEIL